MRKITFTFFRLVLCLATTGAYAQSAFSDGATGMQQNPNQAILSAPAIQLEDTEQSNLKPTTNNQEKDVCGSVEFFFYRPTFDFEVCVDGDLTLEDFDDMAPGVFCGRPSGLNSVTASVDGSCFPPGSIEAGFNYRTNTGSELAALGENLFGSHPDCVAPNFFADNILMEITQPGVRAISFDFVDQPNAFFGNGFGTFTLEVFGAGGAFLGSTDFTANGGISFVGFTADEDITSFTVSNSFLGKPITNLAFGTCDAGLDVITSSFWVISLPMVSNGSW